MLTTEQFCTSTFNLTKFLQLFNCNLAIVINQRINGPVNDHLISGPKLTRSTKKVSPNNIPFTQLLQTRVCFTNAGINNHNI